jgi:quinoprotein relay system zinc metallohydrolase 1
MRLFILALLTCLALTAQAELRYQLEPREIAEGVWLLEGSTDNFDKQNGANIVNTAFIVTDSGVVVIDTGPSKRYGEAQREAIAQVTSKPVIKVLLTHHHPDHVLGNQAYDGVPIAALDGTTALLREQGDAMAENMYRMVGDWMRGTEVVLPSDTVKPGVLDIDGRRLQLFGMRGHTGADLVVFDEATGVLLASDMLFYQRALTTPNSPGLDIWLAELDTLQALPWKLLVPGHGPVASDAAPFAQMRDYLGWLDSTLRNAAASGADMNEVLATPIPQRFAGISLTAYEFIRSVSHLYPGYEAQALQRIDR